MAGEKRGLPADLIDELLENGGEFSFFQTARLLKRTSLKNGETPTLKPNLSLAFAGKEVESVSKTQDGYRAEINLFSIYGTFSPLSNTFTEELFEEERRNGSQLRDAADILSRRLYELLFSVMSKYKSCYQIVEERNEELLERIFSLSGQGELNWRESPGERVYPLRHAALLTQKNRTAVGLETLLKDSFGVPISVLPAQKRKVPLPEEQMAALGVANAALGQDFHIGDEFFDRGKNLIRIGPLEAGPRLKFTPGSPDYQRLLELTGAYLGESSADSALDDFEIEASLKQGKAEPMRLDGEQWSALGNDAWLL